MQACLDRIGEVQPRLNPFCFVYLEEALKAAEAAEEAVMRGGELGPLHGVPIAIKDFTPTKGKTTTRGSVAFRNWVPDHDPVIVRRLGKAGGILVGKTTTPEFAFSSFTRSRLWGSTLNPWDETRSSGGSSGGSAVAVATGCVALAEGTDMGGSVRIPAALCGIVGFKPTGHRVSIAGAFPLSTSLDSVGPLAATVACCAVLDAVLAGEPMIDLPPFPLAGLRMAVPQTMVLENVEPAVARAFESALAVLGKTGARIVDIPLRELAELSQINAKGGFAAPEAYAIHRSLIRKGEKMYDPRVLARILRGQEQDAADYIDLVNARADFIRRVAAVTAPYDALVMPTVPVTAPALADLAADDAYRHTNFLVLRNPSVANFLDRCSVSIPCHQAGDPPVGLMLMGEHGADRRLLAIAAAIEAVVSPTLE